MPLQAAEEKNAPMGIDVVLKAPVLMPRVRHEEVLSLLRSVAADVAHPLRIQRDERLWEIDQQPADVLLLRECCACEVSR